MKELMSIAFASQNIIPTILLVFTIVYWITVIAGLIDMDAIDVDVDIHADTDIDVDIHADADADLHATAEGDFSISWVNSILAFFNLGQVPFMIFLSFVALPMWVISILTNYYLGIQTFPVALLLLIPIFIASLFISKIFTSPFVRLFGKIDDKNIKTEDLIGKTGTVALGINPGKIGQVDAVVDGQTLRISAINKSQPIHKNDNVLIIDYDAQTQQYLVEPYEPLA